MTARAIRVAGGAGIETGDAIVETLVWVYHTVALGALDAMVVSSAGLAIVDAAHEALFMFGHFVGIRTNTAITIGDAASAVQGRTVDATGAI